MHHKGAGELGPYLESVYGQNGFAMVVDEGCESRLICKGCRVVYELYPAGFMQQFGSAVASPGIAEKGFINVLVEVTAPGGHSSIPPAHTVISFFIVPISLIKYL